MDTLEYFFRVSIRNAVKLNVQRSIDCQFRYFFGRWEYHRKSIWVVWYHINGIIIENPNIISIVHMLSTILCSCFTHFVRNNGAIWEKWIETILYTRSSRKWRLEKINYSHFNSCIRTSYSGCRREEEKKMLLLLHRQKQQKRRKTTTAATLSLIGKQMTRFVLFYLSTTNCIRFMPHLFIFLKHEQFFGHISFTRTIINSFHLSSQ